jgi:hypothetical protein
VLKWRNHSVGPSKPGEALHPGFAELKTLVRQILTIAHGDASNAEDRSFLFNRLYTAKLKANEDDYYRRGRIPISKLNERRGPGRPSTLPEELKQKILEEVKLDPEPNFSRIARKYHVSDMTVKRIAAAWEIGPGPHNGVRVSEDKQRDVLALYPHVRSFRAVAAAVGIDPKTVAKIVKKDAEGRLPQSRHLTPG